MGSERGPEKLDMNVGIDVRKIQDYGIGTHIREVILPATTFASECRFYFYCNPEDREQDQENRVWIDEHSGKYSVSEHFSLAKKARQNQLQLFHAPHYTLPLRIECKCIVTVHDLIHLKFRNHFPYWKVKAAEYILRKAIEKADLILTVSETSRKDLLEFFPFAEKKLEVLYNRLSNDWFLPPPELDLSALGIASEFILYAGNFKKHKSVDLLVEAYRNLQSPPPLVLVGGNSHIDSSLLEKIWNTRGIRLLGFAESRLLRKLYSRALLFVFPSLYEGFGYPPLEAMAASATVLSSDAASLQEILGANAAYFAAGEKDSLIAALQQLLQDENRRKQLGQAGREHARRFATETSPRRLAEIYNGFRSK